MRIAGDTNQFNKGSHYNSNLRKHRDLQKLGHEVIQLPLPVGDYTAITDAMQDVIDRKAKRGTAVKKMDFTGTYGVVVDTKKSLVEIAGNVCGKGHERFRDECILAQNNNIEFWVLIENEEGVEKLSDLFARGQSYVMETALKQTKYGEKRLPVHKTKLYCITLARALYTMQQKYGIHVSFCKPHETAKRIVEILEDYQNRKEEKHE